MRPCSCALPLRFVWSRNIHLIDTNSTMYSHSQFCVKTYSVKYSDNITWMINYVHDIYKINAATKCRQRAELFDRFAFYTEIIFKVGFLLYAVSMLSYFVYPFYMYLFKGEVVALIPTYAPGINEKSFSGFITLTCYHLLLMALAVIAVAACDLLFTMLIANVPVMANLIAMEVQELNEILTSKRVDELRVKFKLRNIFLMRREMTE